MKTVVFSEEPRPKPALMLPLRHPLMTPGPREWLPRFLGLWVVAEGIMGSRRRKYTDFRLWSRALRMEAAQSRDKELCVVGVNEEGE